jgi:hypothetical protein
MYDEWETNTQQLIVSYIVVVIKHNQLNLTCISSLTVSLLVDQLMVL